MVWGISWIYIGLIMGGMFWWGAAKDWSSEKPILNPNPERFWPKPNASCTVPDPYADEAPIRTVSKDCYSKWYYWQLPEDEVTVATRAFVWILYVLHQLSHWAFIWIAQQDRAKIIARKEEVYRNSLYHGYTVQASAGRWTSNVVLALLVQESWISKFRFEFIVALLKQIKVFIALYRI